MAITSTDQTPRPSSTFADHVADYATAGWPQVVITPAPAAHTDPSEVGARPVALYRHVDAHGELIYVGITSDLARRWWQHREFSPWARFVTHTYAQWLPDRPTARRLEVLAINREQPLFNRARAHRRQADAAFRNYVATGRSGLPRRVPCPFVVGEFCISCGPDADTWLDTRLQSLMEAS